MSNDNQLDLDVVVSSQEVVRATLEQLLQKFRNITMCSLPARISLIYHDDAGLDEQMVTLQGFLDDRGMEAKAIYVETYNRVGNTRSYTRTESYCDHELLSEAESDSLD